MMIKNYYPTYFITNATLDNGNLVLTVNGNPSMSEHTHFAMRFAPHVAIPSGVGANVPVVLSINGTNYEIKDKYAEPVVFSELPRDRINDTFFSPRFAIVGGVGSSDDSYYFVAWDVPVI